MTEKVGKIEIVIKGGKPWGFRLQAKAENRSVVIVEEIVKGGRADQQGKLKVGDHVIKINGIQCLSLADALQLIESAFRTLTIVVWRTNYFLSKDKSKDYFESAQQFEQLPISPPSHSPNDSQTSLIYENVNFSFQEGKQRSRRLHPVENVYHNNKDDFSISNQQLPSKNIQTYSGRNDFYRNNFKSSNPSLNHSSKNEPDRRTGNVSNPERKLHSKTQRDLHQYSNVQPLPALNYMPEINKYEGRHFSRTLKKFMPNSVTHSINNSTYGKIFKISNSPEPTVPTLNQYGYEHSLNYSTNGKVDSPEPAAMPSISLPPNNIPTINTYVNVHSLNNSINGKVDSPEPAAMPYIPLPSNNIPTINQYVNVHSLNNSFNGKVDSPKPTAVPSVPSQSNNSPAINQYGNVHSLNYSTHGKVDSPESAALSSIPLPSNNNPTINHYSNVHFLNSSSNEKGFKVSDSLERTAVSSVPLPATNIPTVNQYSNAYPINSSNNRKFLNVSGSPEPTAVPSILEQANNSLVQNPVSNRLTNAKVSSESDCCRYPNCHNKYFNCKIHSPPERDVTYPVSESFSNDYENIDFLSQSSLRCEDQSSCDSLNYEQNFRVPPLNSMPFENKKKVSENKSSKWEKDYVPSYRCDYPAISSSTKPPNYKLEPLNYIVPKTTANTCTTSASRNSMTSLCHFSSSVYEEKLSYPVINSPAKPPNYKLEVSKHIVPKTVPDIRFKSGIENSMSSVCQYPNNVFVEKHDSPVINSSTKPPNYKLESLKCVIPKTTSDIYATSANKNSVSTLCHFSNNVFDEKLNSQAKVSVTTNETMKDSNVFHYKSVYGQIKHTSYNMQGNESASESLYSSSSKPCFNKRMFSSMNNASFMKENDMFFGASNNSMCMISKEAAVVKLVSSRPQKIYIDEDDELKEIDENRNKTAVGFSSISMSPPPPTPPPENGTEILPCHEPLPAPPLFVSEQKQNNGNEMVETIYANLEMLKIQYSVVSSQQSSSNEQNSMTFSNSIESITDNISPSANTSYDDQSGLMESNRQGEASIKEKTLQNPERKKLPLFNLPFNSAYFTTSVPKAKLLTRYTSELQSDKMPEVGELSNEKEELISSLRKKLDILLEEEAAVQDELQQNEELGHILSEKLESTATQNEWKKFSNHVQELEKITNLLLSLSGRSARTKNALLILPTNAPAEEKMLLETKYKKLSQQYEEALQLQKNIDNRNKQVLFYLQKYFTKDELADYNHFIKMKVKLLVDYKELVEKIKLGEEQLKALTNS